MVSELNKTEPAVMLKTRVALLPLIFKPDPVGPLMIRFFEIAIGDANNTGPLTPKWIESFAFALATRSRSVPGPLSAALVTINKAAAACGAMVTRLNRVNSTPKAVAVADRLACLEIGAAEQSPPMKECAMFIRIYGKDRAPLQKKL